MVTCAASLLQPPDCKHRSGTTCTTAPTPQHTHPCTPPTHPGRAPRQTRAAAGPPGNHLPPPPRPRLPQCPPRPRWRDTPSVVMRGVGGWGRVRQAVGHPGRQVQRAARGHSGRHPGRRPHLGRCCQPLSGRHGWAGHAAACCSLLLLVLLLRCSRPPAASTRRCAAAGGVTSATSVTAGVTGAAAGDDWPQHQVGRQVDWLHGESHPGCNRHVHQRQRNGDACKVDR